MHAKKYCTLATLVISLVPALAFAASNDTVEMTIRAQFAAHPEMIAIADCESRFRQFDDSGNVLDGGSGGMVGIYQVNASVHRAFAKSLGFDIDTIEGNILYANYLYQKEGTAPWLDSFPCWSKSAVNAENSTTTVTATLSRDLSLGMIDPDVLVLQRLLNAAGFTVAKDGPGSAGNETNKFGAFTRIALQKFQCAHLSVCSGSEYTSGYGFAGARTRSALLSYVPGASPAPVTTAATQSSDATTAQTVSAEDQVKIAALQAQIAQLTQILLDLIKRRNAAMGV